MDADIDNECEERQSATPQKIPSEVPLRCSTGTGTHASATWTTTVTDSMFSEQLNCMNFTSLSTDLPVCEEPLVSKHEELVDAEGTMEVIPDFYTGAGKNSPGGNSESSNEFIDNMYRELEKSEKETSDASVQTTSGFDSIPDDVDFLVGAMVKDSQCFAALISIINQGITKMGLAFQKFEYGSEKATNFAQRLEGMGQQKLAALTGHYLSALCPAVAGPSTYTKDSPGVNSLKLGGHDLYPTSKVEDGPGPSRPKKQKLDIPQEGGDCLPPTLVFRPVVPPTFEVPDAIWQDAYNSLTQKKIEIIGKVFFDAIMSRKEIETQSLSGRKPAAEAKFNDDKIWWIRAASVFIWRNPPIESLNSASFEMAWKNGLVDISKSDRELFNSKVFTEHASQLRGKYKATDSERN